MTAETETSIIDRARLAHDVAVRDAAAQAAARTERQSANLQAKAIATLRGILGESISGSPPIPSDAIPSDAFAIGEVVPSEYEEGGGDVLLAYEDLLFRVTFRVERGMSYTATRRTYLVRPCPKGDTEEAEFTSLADLGGLLGTEPHADGCPRPIEEREPITAPLRRLTLGEEHLLDGMVEYLAERGIEPVFEQ